MLQGIMFLIAVTGSAFSAAGTVGSYYQGNETWVAIGAAVFSLNLLMGIYWAVNK